MEELERLGIIYIPWKFFEDYTDCAKTDKYKLTLEQIVDLVKLPTVFKPKDYQWDFDTCGVKIKVSSKILPIYIYGEVICSIDLIYYNGIPKSCFIYNRIVIKEQGYEKAFI